MDIHLLVWLHAHMLTPRAHRTMQVLTRLLPTHPTTCLFNYLCDDTGRALHPTPTCLHTHSLASLLTYLFTCLHTCSLQAYLLTYSLSPRVTPPSTFTYLHTCIVTNTLMYLLADAAYDPSLHTYLRANLLTRLLPNLLADARSGYAALTLTDLPPRIAYYIPRNLLT